jgi:hypothetical protein
MKIGLLLHPLSYTPKSPEGDFGGCIVLKPLQGFGVMKKCEETRELLRLQNNLKMDFHATDAVSLVRVCDSHSHH